VAARGGLSHDQNNLDPAVAEHPDQLIVYGGIGKAARNWDCFEKILQALKTLENDETLLVQSGKPIGILRTMRRLRGCSWRIRIWCRHLAKHHQPFYQLGKVFPGRHFGTKFEFARSTRGASSWVRKMPIGFPDCTNSVSSFSSVFKACKIFSKQSQLRAALPIRHRR